VDQLLISIPDRLVKLIFQGQVDLLADEVCALVFVSDVEQDVVAFDQEFRQLLLAFELHPT
jgi:hypothetical protein